MGWRSLQKSQLPPTQTPTDLAYRQAVQRLRRILCPRMPTPNANTIPLFVSHMQPLHDQKRNELHQCKLSEESFQTEKNGQIPIPNNQDLLNFVNKQGGYIIQLEKELTNVREEMGQMLTLIEEIIIENESLHERQREEAMNASLQTASGEVRNDSELYELRRSLRIAQDEVLNLRKETRGSIQSLMLPSYDSRQAEIQAISKERNDMLEKVASLQQELKQLKNREIEATEKVKASLEIVEQLQIEKQSLSLESTGVRAELEQLQKHYRDVIRENSGRHLQELAAAERKCQSEFAKQLAEAQKEVETCTHLKWELEKTKEVDAELRRELQLKTRLIDSVRLEMQSRISELENHLHATNIEKVKIDSELINVRIQGQKADREGKAEHTRLQIELATAKQRLIDVELDLRRVSEIVVKFRNKIRELEEKINMDETSKTRNQPVKIITETDVKMIVDTLQARHDVEKRNYEKLIRTEANLMQRLKSECVKLTSKLEEIAKDHLKERMSWKETIKGYNMAEAISNKKCAELEQKVQFYAGGQQQLVNRLHFLEEDQMAHSQKISGVLMKQKAIKYENDKLRAENTLLHSQHARELPNHS